MKKYTWSLLLLCHSMAYAAQVAEPDARTVALNFYNSVRQTAPAAQMASIAYRQVEADNSVDFYVFNLSPGNGFVIVAGFDNIIPVLGYSTEGSFNSNFRHSPFQHWVNKTSANIRLAVQHGTLADTRIQGLWAAYLQNQAPVSTRSTSAGPYCQTRWDQENLFTPPPYLYNLYCPFNSTDGQRCLTGCVATAMAQIMKYWNYPVRGRGQYSYNDNTSAGYLYNYGVQYSDFGAHAYQWAAMPTVLSNTSTGIQDTAVGLLMYDCAVSVGMDFGDDNQGGSGANGLLYEELACCSDSICSQTAFVKYFSYNPDSIQGVVEANYTQAAWISLIEQDLDKGRVILYEGNDSTQGGHAWVCDGYDANMLHMNWGWSGLDNGYFAVNNLSTPGTPPYNPIENEDALIGIIPMYPTGISIPVSDQNFRVFPNPAAHQLMIRSSPDFSDASWEIQNILGQTIKCGLLEQDQTSVSVDGLSNGPYLIRLKKDLQYSVQKILIEH